MKYYLKHLFVILISVTFVGVLFTLIPMQNIYKFYGESASDNALNPLHDTNPTISLLPVSSTKTVGEQVTFQLIVDPMQHTLDFADLSITYPTDLLELTVCTFMPEWEDMKAEHNPGLINREFQMPENFSEVSTIGLISFKTINPGIANIEFDSDGLLLDNYQINVFDNEQNSNAQVKIVAP